MFVTITVIFMAAAAVLLAVLVIAGISAVFGASFRKVFLKGLWALLVPPLLLLYGMLIERNAYEINEVEIAGGNVPESFDGYRIVQISDMHLASFKNRHRSLARAVEMINGLDPDLILFTGDLVTYLPDELDGFEPMLSSLKASDGVYSVLGNHDYCIYNRWESDSLRAAAVRELVARETALGWKVLMNENVNIGRSAVDTISLAGVENISSTSHDPTHWHKALEDYPDIDLTLSGHTHAMQFSVFGWSPGSLMFDEYRGLYGKDGDSVLRFRHGGVPESMSDKDLPLLYVNIGLGETAIPARVGTRPEITLFTLSHKK